MSNWKNCFASCFSLSRGGPAGSFVNSTQPLPQPCPSVDAEKDKTTGNAADLAEEVSLYALVPPAKGPSLPHVLPNTAQFAFWQSLPQSNLTAVDVISIKDARRALHQGGPLPNEERPFATGPSPGLGMHETASWSPVHPPFLWPSVRATTCNDDGTSSTTPAQPTAARVAAPDKRTPDSTDDEADPTFDNADYAVSRASDSNCSLDSNTLAGSALSASSRSTAHTRTTQQTTPAAGTSPPSLTAGPRFCPFPTSCAPAEEPRICHLSTRSSSHSTMRPGRGAPSSPAGLTLLSSSPSNTYRPAGTKAPRLNVYSSLAAMLEDLQDVRLLKGTAGGGGGCSGGDGGGASTGGAVRGRSVVLRGRLSNGAHVVIHMLGCCALHAAAGPALRSVMVAGSAVHPAIAKVYGMRFLPAAAAAAAFRCPHLPAAAAGASAQPLAPAAAEAGGLGPWGNSGVGPAGGPYVPALPVGRHEAGADVGQEVEADAAAAAAVAGFGVSVGSAGDAGVELGRGLPYIGVHRHGVSCLLARESSLAAATAEWPQAAAAGPASPQPDSPGIAQEGQGTDAGGTPPTTTALPQQQRSLLTRQLQKPQQPQQRHRYNCGVVARNIMSSTQLASIAAALQLQLCLRSGEGVLAVVYEGSPMGSLESLLGGVHNPFRPNRSWPAYMARRALLRTAMEVAGALAHLHARGLVHGCLRPCNVLLVPSSFDRRNFRAKIFGACTRMVNLLGTSHSATSIAVGACESGKVGGGGGGGGACADAGSCTGACMRGRSISSPQSHIAATCTTSTTCTAGAPWPAGTSVTSREHPPCASAAGSPYGSSPAPSLLPSPSLPTSEAAPVPSVTPSSIGNGNGAADRRALRLGSAHVRVQGSRLLAAATAVLTHTAASDSDGVVEGGLDDFALSLACGGGSCPGRQPRFLGPAPGIRAPSDSQQAALPTAAGPAGSSSGGGGVPFRRSSRRLLLTGFAIPEQLEVEAAAVAEAEAMGVGRRRSDGGGGGGGGGLRERNVVAASAWCTAGAAVTTAPVATREPANGGGSSLPHRGEEGAAEAEGTEGFASRSARLSYSNGVIASRCGSGGSPAATASAAPRLVSLLRAVMSGRATNTDSREPAPVSHSHVHSQSQLQLQALMPRVPSVGLQSSVASTVSALLSRRPSFLASATQERDIPRLVGSGAAHCGGGGGKQTGRGLAAAKPSQPSRVRSGAYDNALLARSTPTPTPGASPSRQGGGMYGSGQRGGDIGQLLASTPLACSPPQTTMLVSSVASMVLTEPVEPPSIAFAAAAVAGCTAAAAAPSSPHTVVNIATLSGASNAFLTGTATGAATTTAVVVMTHNDSAPASHTASATAGGPTTGEGNTFSTALSAAAAGSSTMTMTTAAAPAGLDSQPSAGCDGRWRDELFMCPEAQLNPHRRADPSHDTWAFGMLLWAMAARGPPAAEPEHCPPEVLNTLEFELGIRAPNWPGACDTHSHLRPLYEACVARVPERRPSMAQILAQLELLEKELREHHGRSQKAAAAAAVGGFMLLDRRRALSRSHVLEGQQEGAEGSAGGGGTGLLQTMPADLRAALLSQHRRQEHHHQHQHQQHHHHQQYHPNHHHHPHQQQ